MAGVFLCLQQILYYHHVDKYIAFLGKNFTLCNDFSWPGMLNHGFKESIINMDLISPGKQLNKINEKHN